MTLDSEDTNKTVPYLPLLILFFHLLKIAKEFEFHTLQTYSF